jgi:hypothetical protein
MKNPARSLVALSFVAAFTAATLSAPALASPTTLQPLADKAAAKLPLSGSFAKGTPGENGGPYALTLKNTSKKTLTVEGTIIWSVASHNRANTIKLPPREIAAGESWIINDLAAEDRVILTAEGYEKLEFKTPPGK